MSVATLEINDAGLILASADSSAGGSKPSPGFALIDGSDLTVGREALHRARHHPRHVDHTFWDRLDTDPLGRPFPARMSRADLAHAHLLEIWRPDHPAEDRGVATVDEPEVLLAVPGWYSAEQLGLLLGIARAAEIPVTGMVDSALAAIAQGPIRGARSVHLELFLHRAAATRVEDGSECVRRQVEAAEDSGLIVLHAAWAKALAEVFVRRTRFDPLLEGASEQQLYDRLPLWLEEATKSRETVVEMSSGGESYSIEVDREAWLAPVEPAYGRIVGLVRDAIGSDAVETVRISSRIAALPGLEERLVEATGLEVTAIEEGAAARGALRYAAQIREPGDTLPFITRLLRQAAGDSAAAGERAPTRAANEPQPAPTHLLYRGTAYPLTDRAFVIGVEDPVSGCGLRIPDTTAGISRAHCRIVAGADGPELEDLSRYGTLVNGQRIEGRQPLAVGDVLRLGSPGTELTLILVAGRPPGAAT